MSQDRTRYKKVIVVVFFGLAVFSFSFCFSGILNFVAVVALFCCHFLFY